MFLYEYLAACADILEVKPFFFLLLLCVARTHQDPSVCTNFIFVLDDFLTYCVVIRTYIAFSLFIIIFFIKYINKTVNVFAIDINECKYSPCGNNTICTDTIGSFVCSCKEDYTGDPMKGCQGIYFFLLRYFY